PFREGANKTKIFEGNSHHLPLTTYHLPLTTYHLPLTTYRSPLTTQHYIIQIQQFVMQKSFEHNSQSIALQDYLCRNNTGTQHAEKDNSRQLEDEW
ncbi:MAG TPA: hypothetical protein PK704_07350, partial [Saprospiraceae bacterium]|nr:hypothetical protein [Saprospiraceae bacterium]